MLMLAPPTALGVNSVVLCGGTNSFVAQLAGAISQGSSTTTGVRPRCSPVLEWEGLKDVSCAVCGSCAEKESTRPTSLVYTHAL